MRNAQHIGLDGNPDMAKPADDMIEIWDEGVHSGRWRITAKKLLPVNGYDKVKDAPNVLTYKDHYFTWIAWNSDTGDVYYGEAPVAKIAAYLCKKCAKWIHQVH